MIWLPDDLLDPLIIEQVSMKGYLRSKKTHLS